MNFRPPERWRSAVKIGTCSWKYDSWKGLVYDPAKSYRPADYLADYARVFDTVEVDQWFWSLFPGTVKLPDPWDVKLYAASVPDDFVFTIKAPNALTLTHFYTKSRPSDAALAGTPNPRFLDPELLAQFLERLEPLGKKTGPIMFQFEYLNLKKMPSKAAFIEAFGAFIRKAPREFSYAVEIRNPNYFSAEYFAFLKENGLGVVYLDGYHMPSIRSVFETYRPATADFSVVRLHGTDREAMELETRNVWNTVTAPKPAGLAAAAEITREQMRKQVKTYLNVNNHYEGSAPLTAERLIRELETGAAETGTIP